MKFVRNIIFPSLLLSCLLVAWPGQGVNAQGEGVQLLAQEAPVLPGDTSIWLFIGREAFGNFANIDTNADPTDDNSRLVIQTANESEVVRIGLPFGASISNNGNLDRAVSYRFQIRDLSITDYATSIVHGGIIGSGGTAPNIQNWDQAKYDPANGGYSVNEPIYTFRPARAGSFSIEFQSVSNVDRFLIPYWNFTVVDPTVSAADSIKTGRLWSKNWAFRTPENENPGTPPECIWTRPFGGDFYSYTSDSLVSKVDFAGTNMIGLSFNIAFNSTGPGQTGNLLNDRRSIEGENATDNTAEHLVFLSPPDPDLFPTTVGECATVEVREEELGCVDGLFCVPITISGPGQVELSWVRADGTELPIGLSDFPRSVFPASGSLDTCVAITAFNTIDNDVSSLSLRVTYSRGAQHWAGYDIEFMDKGFCVSTEPAFCTDIPGYISGDDRLYWNDTLITSMPGGNGLQVSPIDGSDCSTDQRGWDNFRIINGDCGNLSSNNTEGYGDQSTLNTWWYAYSQELDVVDFPIPTVAISGLDTVCSLDNVVFRADVSGINEEVISYSWTGPDEITGSADTIIATAAGEYCVTIISENNCERSACKTLTVGEGGIPNVSFPESEVVLCPGADFDVSLDLGIGNPENFTYFWSPANAFVDNTLAMPDYLEEQGAQEIMVLVTDLVSGCDTTISLSIVPFDPVIIDASVIFDDNCTPVDTLRATVTGDATVEWLDAEGNVVGSGLELVTNTGPGESVFTARAISTTCADTTLSAALTVRFEPVDITLNGPTDPVCAGDEVVLSVTNNDSPRDTLTYVWEPAGSFADNTLAAPDYIESTGNQTVTVTATNQFGCEDSRTIDVSILEPLTITAEVIFDDVCTPVDTLRATVSDGAIVEWIDADGNLVGTGPELVTSTGPGESVFTARAINEACMDTLLSEPLTVSFEPVDITLNGPTAPVCAGDEVVLSVTNNDSPRDTLTYVWEPAGSFADNTLAAPDYIESTGNQTVTVTATNQFGCEDSRTIDVSILEPLTITAEVIFDDVCTPVDTLRATVSDGAIVEWIDADGNLVGTGPELVTNTGPGESVFTARAINEACMDTLLSEPLTVSFEPVDITLNGPTGPVCAGDEVVLSVTNNDSPRDTLTYVWEPAGSFADNTLAAPDYIESTGNQTVTVTATNQFGCEDSRTIDISILEPLTITAEVIFDDVCTPVDTLRATVSDGAIVEWIDADGNLVGTGPELVTNTGPGESVFTARAINEACMDTLLSEPLTVSYEPVDITLNGPTGPVCAGDEVVLSVTNNDSPRDTLTYVWEPAGSFADNTLAAPDYIESTGNQTVTVTATNQFGCEDSRTIDVSILDPISLEAEVIAPDDCTPAVNLLATLTGEATVEWLDGDGNVVGTGLELMTTSGEGVSVFTARAINEACMDTVFSEPLTVRFEPVNISVEQECNAELELSVLNNDPDDILTFFWAPADNFVDNTLAMPDFLEENGAQNISVTATNQFNCEATEALTTIDCQDDCTPDDIYFPNFFSPNGDGSNDVIRLRSKFLEELTEVELMIYNRWGEEVFRTTDKFDEWDGTFNGEQLAPDVYGYWLRYSCPGDEPTIRKGNITLMR